MINLIKADLYKETRKRSFKIICILIIFVSILYICLISKNVNKEELFYTYPLMNIDEYKDSTIMRVDLLRLDDDYVVLEMELVDPFLSIETIPDRKTRNLVYSDIVKSVIKKKNK